MWGRRMKDKRQKAKIKRQKVGRGRLPFDFCLLPCAFHWRPVPRHVRSPSLSMAKRYQLSSTGASDFRRRSSRQTPRSDASMNATKRSTSSTPGILVRMRGTASTTRRPRFEHEPVGAAQGADRVGVETAALEPEDVEAVQRGAVAGRVAERRHVLRDHRPRADDRRLAQTDELVDPGEGADHDAGFDRDVSAELGAVGDDVAVAEEAVVGDVRVVHQQVAGDRPGSPCRRPRFPAAGCRTRGCGSRRR